MDNAFFATGAGLRVTDVVGPLSSFREKNLKGNSRQILLLAAYPVLIMPAIGILSKTCKEIRTEAERIGEGG